MKVTNEDIGKYCIINGISNGVNFRNTKGKIIDFLFLGINVKVKHNNGHIKNYELSQKNITHIYNYTFDDENEEYEVINPFTLFDLYYNFDYKCESFQREFYNLLSECTYKNINFTISHKFTTFNKEHIPETLWENRKHLQEKGFIKRKVTDPILKSGMTVKNIYTNKTYNIIESDHGYLYLTPDCGKDFTEKVYVLNHQIKKGYSLTDLNNIGKFGDFFSGDFKFEICEED